MRVVDYPIEGRERAVVAQEFIPEPLRFLALQQYQPPEKTAASWLGK
jgi:hypothetical protein